MSSIESIVPPLELCKRIPAGEFEDSALVWCRVRGEDAVCQRTQWVGIDGTSPIPAPTVEEIRRELRNLSVDVIDNTIRVSCKIDPETHISEIALNENDVTAAALRLWFKGKGIEGES